MNETLVAPRHHSPSFVDRLCERIVLSAMQRMTRDRLEMTLPAGNQLSIGACNGEPARMKIRDAKFFQRCVLYDDVGFAESYIEGEWETDSLARVIAWAIRNVENAASMSGSKTKSTALNFLKLYNRLLHFLRPNSVATARRNIAEHYDLGNDFYAPGSTRR
jgi:cyclopropane-fatty-acyl-phospholipid synthase